ncbi:unnamed protein product [Polarella glacialis]|uniref:Nuclease associated modular domain-containing protein n=1 Tax=Polarella glacialis TaxID=89957 RepID=A0A813IIH7_POLGL|nr:unnamed protein product [Polarella glacialis]
MFSKESGKFYLGVRMCPQGVSSPEDDVKYQSSLSVKAFCLEPKTKTILTRHASKDAALRAECLLHELFDVARRPGFANKACQTLNGFDRTGSEHSLELRAKLSQARRGKTHSQESKDKTSHSHQGKTHGQEVKDKMSQAHLGKTLSLETKHKMSQAHLDKKLSQETKDKLSKSKKGCVPTTGFLGKLHSQESKDKIGQTMKKCWVRRRAESETHTGASWGTQR